MRKVFQPTIKQAYAIGLFSEEHQMQCHLTAIPPQPYKSPKLSTKRTESNFTNKNKVVLNNSTNSTKYHQKKKPVQDGRETTSPSSDGPFAQQVYVPIKWQTQLKLPKTFIGGAQLLNLRYI